MQVAHQARVLDMLDGAALRALVAEVKPDLIIPEIEAIATDTLAALEQEGVKVVPNARATQLTMNREGIRRLAAETLGLPTSIPSRCSSMATSLPSSPDPSSRARVAVGRVAVPNI